MKIKNNQYFSSIGGLIRELSYGKMLISNSKSIAVEQLLQKIPNTRVLGIVIQEIVNEQLMKLKLDEKMLILIIIQ